MGFGGNNSGTQLSSAGDVAFNNITNHDTLSYDSVSQKWKNSPNSLDSKATIGSDTQFGKIWGLRTPDGDDVATNKKYVDDAIATAIVAAQQSAPQDFNGTSEEWKSAITGNRPSNYSRFRPMYHITARQKWMNDPQRPFYLGGKWHFYFLYNKDYPSGNGTEWYHLTSQDLVSWKYEGVAIQKYQNGLGDIETGSAVVDVNNTAGFGANAVVALLTQMDAGVQVTSLFYSTDNGYTFTSYTGNPVMPNPGQPDFRDPKVMWHAPTNKWVLTLSEHDKTGFYTSSDLKTWTYVDQFYKEDIGIHECSDLFQIDLDGNPNNKKWVFVTGCNGFNFGMTTGCAYWVGSFNGTTFTPDSWDFQWIDTGPDFYAAVTFEDPAASSPTQYRYILGWINNWSYATATPADDFFGNSQSIVRKLELKTIDGKPTLVQTPIQRVRELRNAPTVIGAQQMPTTGLILPDFTGGAYCLDLIMEKSGDSTGDSVRIRVKDSGAGKFTDVIYNFTTSTVTLDRSNCGTAITQATMTTGQRNDFTAVRTAHLPTRSQRVRLTLYIDYNSIEVFGNDGERQLTAAIFPDAGAEKISVWPQNGTILLHQLAYYQMRPSYSM